MGTCKILNASLPSCRLELPCGAARAEVMILFGRRDKGERAQQDQARASEAARLAALSPAELGAQLMPGFGPGAAKTKGDSGIQTMQLLEWLASTSQTQPDLRPLIAPTQAALQTLENAGLVMDRMSGSGSGVKRYMLTPAGSAALADGSYRSVLGVGEA